MCGKSDHKITTCPSASKVRASILQMENTLEILMENVVSEPRQENELATLHVVDMIRAWSGMIPNYTEPSPDSRIRVEV